MKRFLSFILACFLLFALSPAIADTLGTPELVSAPETITFYDQPVFEIKPVQGAEKYVMEYHSNANEIWGSVESEEPRLVFDDWPSWSHKISMTFSITAAAEGKESGEPLVLEYDIIEFDDSLRPDPPKMTITFDDDPPTDRSKFTLTISDGYDAFCVWNDVYGTFPIENTNEFTGSVSSYGRNGKLSLHVVGRKNGVWSLNSETQTFTYTEAEHLPEPEVELLTDPIYINEPIAVRFLSPIEKAEQYCLQLRGTGNKGLRTVFGSGTSEDLECPYVIIEKWRAKLLAEMEPGEYNLVVFAAAEKYNSDQLVIPVTLQAERPDEEKVTLEQLQVEYGLLNSDKD